MSDAHMHCLCVEMVLRGKLSVCVYCGGCLGCCVTMLTITQGALKHLPARPRKQNLQGTLTTKMFQFSNTLLSQVYEQMFLNTNHEL